MVCRPETTFICTEIDLDLSDLLCISDRETWAYGEALRTMVVEKGFNNISFARLRDLLNYSVPEKMSEIVYVANCTTFRRLLLNRFGKEDIDIDHEIATNPDTKLTYLGYKRFLESDLQYIYPRGENRSAHSYKRDCKYLAKQMLIRGYVSICFLTSTRSLYTNIIYRHLRKQSRTLSPTTYGFRSMNPYQA